jgi:LPXTG-motif cell wall-anchored protein
MDQRSGRRYALAGLASMGAGALILVGALPGGAGAAVEQSVEPTEVPDNPDCADLAPEGTTWIELRVPEEGDDVTSGTFSDGTLTVTITVRDTDDGPVFDWTSNIGVDAVIVKGGPNANFYLYDPPAESTGDTGLHAPVNPSGKFAGLSHVSFCYDVEQATTTTSTTSTTVQETTSTTVGETSTTAVAPSTTAPGGELPVTGSTVSPMLGVGAALLIGGGLLLAYARRFRAS